MPAQGGKAREPKTAPQLCMAVLYGELESPQGTKIIGRAALVVGIEGHDLILQVFRPVGEGTGTQERPTGYSSELAAGCWTYPEFSGWN